MLVSTLIFSEGNDLLTPFLIRQLVKNQCHVTVVTTQPQIVSYFLQEVLKMPATSPVVVISSHDFKPEGYEYVLSVDSGSKVAIKGQKRSKLEFNAKHNSSIFQAGRDLVKVGHGKLLEVHSLFSTADFVSPPEIPFYKAIFVGEVFAVGMDTNSEIGTILNTATKTLAIPVSAASSQLWIIDGETAAESITRQTFSYWYTGKSATYALSAKVTYSSLLQELLEANQSYRFVPKESIHKKLPTQQFDFLPLKNYVPKVLSTVASLSNQVAMVAQSSEKPRQVVVTKSKKKKTNSKQLKTFLLTIIGLLWLALLPAILLASSALFLKQAAHELLASNESLARPLVSYAKTSSAIALRIFSVVDIFPTKPFAQSADFLNRAATLADDGLSSLADFQILRQGIVGKDSYDLDNVSNKLGLAFDSLYQDSALLEARLRSSVFLSSLLPRSIDIASMRDYLWGARELTYALPSVLASDGQKTYLVLFQNNMELRPTGGFVGSFALVTFNHGKLIDTTVLDVYSADGQLKGHVEPPAPIRAYLGEANWYLRDSNWDPDFPTSASRAQWFLEKELDRSVDGVIALDLNVVQSLLSYTGPIELEDFQMELNEHNVYEKLQHEVESEFFPGSTKKASLLTSLSKKLLAEITQNNSQGLAKDAQLINLLIKNAEEKHILFSLKDEAAQKVFESLGWSGRVATPVCSDSCHDMWMMVNDANVGVNKANYQLKKSQKINISFTPEKINYTAEVILNNENAREFSLGGQYKGYVRVVVPRGEFSKATVSQNGNTVNMDPEIERDDDKLSAGVVVSVAPGEEASVSFSWSENIDQAVYSKQKPIQVRIMKQPGTDTIPTTITFMMPKTKSIVARPSFDLTQAGAFSYNTALERDFSSSIYFK